MTGVAAIRGTPRPGDDGGAGAGARLEPGGRVLYLSTVPITMMFNAGVARHVASRGWEVHAACAPGPLLGTFAAQTGADVHELPMTRSMHPARDAVALAHLARLVARVRPDVVHAVSPKGGLLGMTAAALARVPGRFYGILGLPADTATGFTRRALLWSDRAACAGAHEVFCVSESVRASVVARGLCAPDKVVVLGAGSVAGIDAAAQFAPGRVSDAARASLRAELGLPAGARVIGFVGRLEREKGILELLDAVRALRATRSDVHLAIVGNGEAKDMIPADAIATLRDDPAIHWCSRYVSTDELAAFYTLVDVVALPSYREGYPTVVLEASAMARPVVAARVPGCTDAVVDGETGRLVPVRDAGALANALAGYLDDPAAAVRDGARGRERVLRDFRPEPIFEAMEGAYARVLRRAGWRGGAR